MGYFLVHPRTRRIWQFLELGVGKASSVAVRKTQVAVQLMPALSNMLLALQSALQNIVRYTRLSLQFLASLCFTAAVSGQVTAEFWGAPCRRIPTLHA
jgi:hypothetical protein